MERSWGITLSSNTTYAFSFGKAVAGGGWDAMGVAANSPYAGGEIGLFPPAGGTITFGDSHQFEMPAPFDLALAPQNIPARPVPERSDGRQSGGLLEAQ